MVNDWCDDERNTKSFYKGSDEQGRAEKEYSIKTIQSDVSNKLETWKDNSIYVEYKYETVGCEEERYERYDETAATAATAATATTATRSSDINHQSTFEANPTLLVLTKFADS